MLNGNKILGLIIARGGSKGLPGKNLVELGGTPMIGWTVEAGKASRHIDRLILSCDDAEIISVAEEYGCEVPFVRDAALANDTATGTDVVLAAIDRVPGFDIVVLLQATSPLRRADDIDGCIERLFEAGAPSCLSVTALEKPAEWLMRMDGNGRLTQLVEGKHADRRQDATAIYHPNGAVYAAHTEWLRETRTFYTDETVAFEMPRERSVDIDTAADLALARHLVTTLNESAG